MSSILFSGRFCKPHTSHFLTIKDLSKKYDKVVIVVLDYEKAFFPLCMRIHILKELLEDYKNVEIKVNKTHFAEITKEEFESFGCDIYGAGNIEVLKHMEKINVPCVYVPRTLGDAASDDVKFQKIEKVVRDG